VRPWLGIERTLASLNREAQARGLQTENAIPVRFVPPATKDAYYEVKVYRSGEVETRPDNVHDFFNALAWLAFPQAKARLNALHAAEIPREGGRRGRLRDLLTIFDEGGAIVQCDQPDLLALLHAMQWKDLFWHQRARLQREMRILVFGHAVLEQALKPWAGITCKAIVVPTGAEPDTAIHAWLGSLAPGASPRDLAPLPVFGFPGWSAAGERAEFYEDTRYFRPLAKQTR
jgi:hypothetical protein